MGDMIHNSDEQIKAMVAKFQVDVFDKLGVDIDLVGFLELLELNSLSIGFDLHSGHIEFVGHHGIRFLDILSMFNHTMTEMESYNGHKIYSRKYIHDKLFTNVILIITMEAPQYFQREPTVGLPMWKYSVVFAVNCDVPRHIEGLENGR